MTPWWVWLAVGVTAAVVQWQSWLRVRDARQRSAEAERRLDQELQRVETLLNRIQSPDITGFRRRELDRVALRSTGGEPMAPAENLRSDIDEAKAVAANKDEYDFLRGKEVVVNEDRREVIVGNFGQVGGRVYRVTEFLRSAGRVPRGRDS